MAKYQDGKISGWQDGRINLAILPSEREALFQHRHLPRHPLPVKQEVIEVRSGG
jgi:hypothetical protein